MAHSWTLFGHLISHKRLFTFKVCAVPLMGLLHVLEDDTAEFRTVRVKD